MAVVSSVMLDVQGAVARVAAGDNLMVQVPLTDGRTVTVRIDVRAIEPAMEHIGWRNPRTGMIHGAAEHEALLALADEAEGKYLRESFRPLYQGG